MRSRNGYTEEQMKKAVDMYVSRQDLRVSDIADQLHISDPSTISHWVKDMGLPLRVPKSEGWKKDCTTSHKSKGKMVTCPECGKRYKVRDGQKFCHLCGADITPMDVRCRNNLREIYNYVEANFVNPHTMQHTVLVDSVKVLVSKIEEAKSDFDAYFGL